MELWVKDKEFLYLIPRKEDHWFYKHKPGDITLWICGISLEWLLNNNYKRVY